MSKIFKLYLLQWWSLLCIEMVVFSFAICRAFASCLYSIDRATTWDISLCLHLINSIRKAIKRTKWINTLFLLMLLVVITSSVLSPWKWGMFCAVHKVTQKTVSLQITWNSLNAREAGPRPWDWLLMSCLLPLASSYRAVIIYFSDTERSLFTFQCFGKRQGFYSCLCSPVQILYYFASQSA